MQLIHIINNVENLLILKVQLVIQGISNRSLIAHLSNRLTFLTLCLTKRLHN